MLGRGRFVDHVNIDISSARATTAPLLYSKPQSLSLSVLLSALFPIRLTSRIHRGAAAAESKISFSSSRRASHQFNSIQSMIRLLRDWTESAAATDVALEAAVMVMQLL